jgi:hypothetical protein
VRNRRIGVSLLVIAICAVGLALMWSAPATSSVQISCLTREEACLQLPTITGSNLAGQTQSFPAAFTKPYQLVVMPFDREQQTRVLDFAQLFQELSAARPDLGYYSMAALTDLAAPIRLLVSGGMIAVVTDPAVRDAAYIFYLEDQPAFLQALDLPDTEAIRVFIFDQAGSVLWQASGDYTPELAASIRSAIAALPQK